MRSGNLLLVTKLHLISLSDADLGGRGTHGAAVSESPLPVHLRTKREFVGASALSNWTAASRLTDLQWGAIHLLGERPQNGPRTGRKRLHDLRSTTELMLTKLAGRCGWNDLKCEPRQVMAAKNLYRSLQRREHLDQVCNIAAGLTDS